jgi:hypothetical protein
MDRKFKTQVINGKFIISELAVDHWTSVDRKLAWQRARSQANPVLFIDLEGNERDLGDAFDVTTWEQAIYSGHISYELSMTDGHYAPEPFEVWIAEFRQFPRLSYNDATPETKAAFDRYLKTLPAMAA